MLKQLDTEIRNTILTTVYFGRRKKTVQFFFLLKLFKLSSIQRNALKILEKF